MNLNIEKENLYIKEIQNHEIFNKMDECDLRDLCNLLDEPFRNINSCISKGQLRTTCKQLLAQNIAMRKILNIK